MTALSVCQRTNEVRLSGEPSASPASILHIGWTFSSAPTEDRILIGAPWCNERERLLQAATDAVNVHTQTLSKIMRHLSDRGRKPDPVEFSAWAYDIEVCFLAAQSAWQQYRAHAQEHGCHLERGHRHM